MINTLKRLVASSAVLAMLAGASITGSALLVPSTAQAAQKKLNVHDVIRMSEAGIPDNLIINKIRATRSTFTLSVDEMIKLKKAGVSDRIIEEMVQTETMKGPVAPPDPDIDGTDAEEEAIFGKGSKDPVPEWQAGKCTMRDAAKLFREKSYPEASDCLFMLIEEGRVRGKDRARARFYLAESLYAMGFFQGSQYYFRENVRQGPRGEFFGKSIVKLLDLSERLRDDRSLQVVLQDIDPRVLPKERKADFFYHFAIIAFKKDQMDRARKYLRAVPKGNPYYRKARYAEGVMMALVGSDNAAIKSFTEAALTPSDGQLGSHLELEARLAIARTLYQAERYDDAVNAFRRAAVMDADLWATSLFENGWALYKAQDFASSLGNLHSTTAPFFDNYYNPEGEVLGAIAYYRLCRFREAEDTIQVFFKKYAPISAKLKAFAKGARKRKPKQVFALVYDYVYNPAKGATFLPDNVMASIASSGKVEDILFQLRVLDLEQARIRSFGDSRGGGRIVDAQGRQVRTFKSSWRSSRVAQWLYEQLQEHKDQLQDFGGRLVIRQVDIMNDSLDDFLNQSKTIRFEITYAEKNQLEASLAGQVTGAPRATGTVDIVAPDDHYFWPFEGEYWKDEIGHFTFAVKSECVK